MPTLAEIRSQIAELEKQAQSIVVTEKRTVIAEIKKLMNEYDLTAEDLEKTVRAPKAPKAPKTPSVIKYRKSDSETWVGRGPKPQWVKAAEEAGENIEQYRV
jgi:DNA-binding protein H-NS